MLGGVDLIHHGPLLRNVVRNLGFVNGHPLAARIREVALNTVICLDRMMIPLLVDMIQADPLEYYVNVLAALTEIADEHPKIKDVIVVASEDPRVEVRSRIPRAIRRYKQEWSRRLINTLAKDQDQSVVEQALRVREEWGMSETERQLVLQTKAQAQSSIPGLQRHALRTIEGRGTLWARDVAEQLCRVSDEQARIGAKRLLAEWNSA